MNQVQLSDFENAAMTVFVVLLTRVLFVFDLDLVCAIGFAVSPLCFLRTPN